MGRAALLACFATSVACGSRVDDAGQTFVASTADPLATSLEVLATGSLSPRGPVVPLGGKRLLLATATTGLAYFDGAATRTLAPTFVVKDSARLANGAMLLVEGHGTLHVFADDTLRPSPIGSVLSTPIVAVAAGANAFYLIGGHSLFVWRDGVLGELRDASGEATMLAVGHGDAVYVADANTLRRIDVGAATGTPLFTEPNISAIATDSHGGVYVAHAATVDLVDAGEVVTYVFPDDVTHLAAHRLMPGVWARTISGELWFAPRGEAPKLAAQDVDALRLDGIGRVLVSNGVTLTRLQRADASDAVIVETTTATIDRPLAIEVGVDDPERVLLVEATTAAHDLLVRKNPWRVLVSPWVLAAGGEVQVTVRSSDAVVARTLVLSSSELPAPRWSDTVADIAGASCTACHHAGAGTKALDVASTWSDDIDDILERVTTGSMPPRPQSPLADDDVARLQGWSLTGHAP